MNDSKRMNRKKKIYANSIKEKIQEALNRGYLISEIKSEKSNGHNIC